MTAQEKQAALSVAATTDPELRQLQIAIAKMRAGVMAVVFGMVGGTALFLATAWLLIRGGQDVGQHLRLLSQYFPGYSVTWLGAFIGLAYGAIVGSVLGWFISTVYNLVARRRR